MRKKNVVLGVATLMAMSTLTTAFAMEPVMTVGGQKPVQVTSNETTIAEYSVILVGKNTLSKADVQLPGGAWTCTVESGGTWVTDEWFEEKVFNWDNQTLNVLKFDRNKMYADPYGYSLQIILDNRELDVKQKYSIWYVDDASQMAGDPAADKMIVLNGTSQGGENQSGHLVEKGAGFWASNDKGWWIQYNDGSYLTNAWYQSPASGLWYYMGADGYMLTNTTTPDGYYVNADGVWVQNWDAKAELIASDTALAMGYTANNNIAVENTAATDTQTNAVTTGKSIVGQYGRQYYEFDNVEVIEGFYNPNSGLPKQPDSYVINPGHRDDSKYVWKFKLMDTLDGEAVYVNMNFEESWYPYEKYIDMMFGAWLQHPEYGMDFWDLELKGGRTSKYRPAFGAYVYSDAIYDEITSIVREYLPHDEDNAVTYTGQGLTEELKAKSKKSEVYKKNTTTVSDTTNPYAPPSDDYKKEHHIGYY